MGVGGVTTRDPAERRLFTEIPPGTRCCRCDEAATYDAPDFLCDEHYAAFRGGYDAKFNTQTGLTLEDVRPDVYRRLRWAQSTPRPRGVVRGAKSWAAFLLVQAAVWVGLVPAWLQWLVAHGDGLSAVAFAALTVSLFTWGLIEVSTYRFRVSVEDACERHYLRLRGDTTEVVRSHEEQAVMLGRVPRVLASGDTIYAPPLPTAYYDNLNILNLAQEIQKAIASKGAAHLTVEPQRPAAHAVARRILQESDDD